LPSRFLFNRKIDAAGRKKMFADAFRACSLMNCIQEVKQGFEVPLLKWFRTELKSMITDDLLSERFIKEQHLFNYQGIKNLLTAFTARARAMQ